MLCGDNLNIGAVCVGCKNILDTDRLSTSFFVRPINKINYMELDKVGACRISS